MNQKTLAIVIVAVLAVSVVAVATYWTLSNADGNDNENTTSVEGANSLQFSVNILEDGESEGTFTYSAKNMNTPDLMMRVEIINTEGDIIYIINGAQQEAWGNIFGIWADLSDEFSSEWDSWILTMDGYAESFLGWSGEDDWTFTEDGATITVYDISVNPLLADSLFEPN
ncbi:hypothetical protein MUO66_09670 [Candidatus Bathyarchaeota archaeon]|nr:hypothetical protein [Candidatus Bathyarchaeota archaeon]